ncbi:MAG: CDP-glycerol glycerophosphotransferase family protein [Candidatus Yonathbacteria bacterium]|nr:CDP-glycerol glycerophosphotransferase family protein [Candidatus Yonathbacteria bacterium]
MNNPTDKSLVILYEMGHVDVILAYFDIDKLKNGDGPIIVPIDYEIEIALRDRGIPFHSMVGYGARSSLKERALLVSRLTRQLYNNPEFNFFEHEGIRLGRIIGYSLSEYLLRILYYLDIFEFIFNQFKNITLIHFPESVIKLSSTVGQLAPFEIRAGIDTMVFLSQKYGVPLNIILCPPNIIARRKFHKLTRSFTRNVFIWSIEFLNKVISLFRSRGAMKIFVSDYWWHIDSFITKMNGVEISMMERKEIQNARDYIWKYKILFNHPSDYSTSSIESYAEEKRQYYEQKWRELGRHPDFSKQFIWYGINFWEIVRPAYKHLITSFSKEVIEMIGATERLFKKQKIEAVILRASASGQVHFSILGLVAHKMGIPAVELQHGLECYEDFSLSIHKSADILASYGPLIQRELGKVKDANLDVINIGSPRFDQYRNEVITKEAESDLIEKMNIDIHKPVFLYVATDIVLGQTHDTYSMLQLFKKIATAVRSLDRLQIIIKIRPGPATEFFFQRAIKESFGDKCRIAQYENLHKLMSISDIIASSFSTVVLEAMIIGKPIILVGIDRNDRMLMESHFLPYEQAQALRIVRTEDELARSTRALIMNPHEGKILVRNANNFVKENFCFDEKSAERMVTFLETLRTKKKVD